MTVSTNSTGQLSPATWQARRYQHRQRMKTWTEPFRQRRRLGQSHPVHDFLFVYYHYSPSKLEHWHPGWGTVLQQAHPNGPSDYQTPQYSVIQSRDLTLDLHAIQSKEWSRLRWTLDLLRQTAQRRGNYSCLGLHEWAMVYRGQEIRHEKTTPLRLPQPEIDRIVESRPLTCTHFDAFRFFAADAQPLNQTQPTLIDRPRQEQPACIHANMDLYKWAYKAMPWIGSDLLADCFELAIAARTIDMRASPYDLSAWPGFEPIKIETAAGRAQYEQAQREIANRAGLVRERLIDSLRNLLAAEPSP